MEPPLDATFSNMDTQHGGTHYGSVHHNKAMGATQRPVLATPF